MYKSLRTSLFLALCLLFAMPAMATDITWIDVRSAGEFASGHVENAVNIPHTEIAERIAEVTTDKDATLYLYCRSGRRSGIATEALQEAGYRNVINVGGFSDAQKEAARLKSG